MARGNDEKQHLPIKRPSTLKILWQFLITKPLRILSIFAVLLQTSTADDFFSGKTEI